MRKRLVKISMPIIALLLLPAMNSLSQAARDSTQAARGLGVAVQNRGPGSWFTAKRVADGVWRIDDRGSDNMYLVEGKDRALLIDTGLGIGDLAGFVKSLTALPLTVVNTHGHPDHAGGNRQFTSVFAHPDDFEMTARFSGGEYRAATVRRVLQETPELSALIFKDSSGLADPKLLAATGGMVFDLGGRKLEVIETPGHTKGSICLMDAGNRLLFTGDNDNTLVWLFLRDCLPLETYLKTLKKVQARSAEFDTLLPGHGDPIDKAFIGEQIVCVENILSGACKGEPYKSFAGDALQCSYQRAGVAFNPDNLFVK
jgi:glyoxylase-like metal-dependent hydrolase (beta-lactamase superfamily II)